MRIASIGSTRNARQTGSALAAIGIAILGATLLAGLGTTTSALTERGVPQAQAEQVRSVAIERVGPVVGTLGFELMDQLDDALRLHVDL